MGWEVQVYIHIVVGVLAGLFVLGYLIWRVRDFRQ